MYQSCDFLSTDSVHSQKMEADQFITDLQTKKITLFELSVISLNVCDFVVGYRMSLKFKCMISLISLR